MSETPPPNIMDLPPVDARHQTSSTESATHHAEHGGGMLTEDILLHHPQPQAPSVAPPVIDRPETPPVQSAEHDAEDGGDTPMDAILSHDPQPQASRPDKPLPKLPSEASVIDRPKTPPAQSAEHDAEDGGDTPMDAILSHDPQPQASRPDKPLPKLPSEASVIDRPETPPAQSAEHDAEDGGDTPMDAILSHDPQPQASRPDKPLPKIPPEAHGPQVPPKDKAPAKVSQPVQRPLLTVPPSANHDPRDVSAWRLPQRSMVSINSPPSVHSLADLSNANDTSRTSLPPNYPEPGLPMRLRENARASLREGVPDNQWTAQRYASAQPARGRARGCAGAVCGRVLECFCRHEEEYY